jgi:hypothetical protein
MNILVEHLRKVCKRNRMEISPETLITFLEEMDEESIIEILNSKDTLDITVRYGLIDVNVESMPPGLKVLVKDYDIQPEPGSDVHKDELGVYFLHEFHRSK